MLLNCTSFRNLQGPESYGAAQFMEKFQRMMKSSQDQQIGSHVTDRMNENPLHTEKGKSPGFNQVCRFLLFFLISKCHQAVTMENGKTTTKMTKTWPLVHTQLIDYFGYTMFATRLRNATY